MKPSISEFNLANLFSDCFSIINSMRGDKKIELRKVVEQGLVLKTDYHRLKRIILNLLTNALKYTLQGYINLKAEVEGSIANIIIEDSGIGIEQEGLKKLFKEFSSNIEGQKDASKSVYNKDGIGLGLVTSVNLVEILGPERKINVVSEKGKGSIFSFAVFKELDTKKVNQKSNIITNNEVSNELLKSKTKALGRQISSVSNDDHLLNQLNINGTPALLNSLPLEIHKRQAKDSSFQFGSSAGGNGSNGKKKVHVFIYETFTEIFEIRALLDSHFSPFKNEFSWNFNYGKDKQKLLGRIIDVSHQVSSSANSYIMVYLGLHKSDTAEKQSNIIHLSRLIHNEMEKHRRDMLCMILVNCTGKHLDKLRTEWKDFIEDSDEEMFFEIFDEMPTESNYCNTMMRWRASIQK